MSDISELKEEVCELKQMIYVHIESFKLHEQQEHSNYTELLDKIDKSCESTEGLVEAWNTATGAIKVISVIGSILKWCAGAAVAWGVVYSLIHGNIPLGK